MQGFIVGAVRQQDGGSPSEGMKDRRNGGKKVNIEICTPNEYHPYWAGHSRAFIPSTRERSKAPLLSHPFVLPGISAGRRLARANRRSTFKTHGTLRVIDTYRAAPRERDYLHTRRTICAKPLVSASSRERWREKYTGRMEVARDGLA